VLSHASGAAWLPHARRLADEILAAIAPVTRDPHGEPRPAPPDENSGGPPPRADPAGQVTQEYES